MDDILSIEQVAAELKLHPKTVQRYLREGKIRAVKTGKQWRVRKSDLENFLSGAAPSNLPRQESTIAFEPVSGIESGGIRTSAVIDLPKLEREETDRLANSIIAVFNSESSTEKGSGARFDHIFNPETGTSKFLLWGNISFIAGILKIIARIAEPQDVSCMQGENYENTCRTDQRTSQPYRGKHPRVQGGAFRM